MTFFLIILCIILMVYTFREARTIWYTENKFAGIVVGAIALVFPVLTYWLLNH